MPDDPNIAEDLVYMAAHPTMFTKAEMAEKLREAAAKIIRDKEALAKVRAGIVEAIGHLDKAAPQLRAKRRRWEDKA